jgi:transposase-like protein
VVVSEQMTEPFFAELDGVGSVTVAARSVGVNPNTAFGWARAAGRRSLAPGGPPPHPDRHEFGRLRSTGMPLRRAAQIVGVNERTARDWQRGVRKGRSRRLYPDGRLVDYARGVTTIIDDPHAVGLSPGRRGAGRPVVSVAERETIADLLRHGASVRAIATHLGRAPSTVSREIRRNSGADGRYTPFTAHRTAAARRSRPKVSKLARDWRLRTYAREKLTPRWSPEQICHAPVEDFPARARCSESPHGRRSRRGRPQAGVRAEGSARGPPSCGQRMVNMPRLRMRLGSGRARGRTAADDVRRADDGKCGHSVIAKQKEALESPPHR